GVEATIVDWTPTHVSATTSTLGEAVVKSCGVASESRAVSLISPPTNSISVAATCPQGRMLDADAVINRPQADDTPVALFDCADGEAMIARFVPDGSDINQRSSVQISGPMRMSTIDFMTVWVATRTTLASCTFGAGNANCVTRMGAMGDFFDLTATSTNSAA